MIKEIKDVKPAHLYDKSSIRCDIRCIKKQDKFGELVLEKYVLTRIIVKEQ